MTNDKRRGIVFYVIITGKHMAIILKHGPFIYNQNCLYYCPPHRRGSKFWHDLITKHSSHKCLIYCLFDLSPQWKVNVTTCTFMRQLNFSLCTVTGVLIFYRRLTCFVLVYNQTAGHYSLLDKVKTQIV